MKPGDLVRIRKSAITAWSTLWFVDLAENKTFPWGAFSELRSIAVKIISSERTVSLLYW
jgi:hypothetical protein